MSLFKRKKKEEEVDNRTDIEKTFEEKGQKIGRKTGTIVQKGVDKFEQVKQKLENDGTIDKFRDFSNKVDDKIDNVVNKVTKATKSAVEKAKSPKKKEEDSFYE